MVAVASFLSSYEMDNKRKHSANYDDARTKSKKSNSGTEYTHGTSSAYLPDSHRVTLPTIVLNMANLQEQINGVPSAWFDNNAIVEVPTSNYSTNDVICNYDPSYYYPDNEIRTLMDDIDTTKHPNEFQYSDDELSTDSSEFSTAISSVSQQDNSYDYYQTENDEEINYYRTKTTSECSTTITLDSQQDNDDDYYQINNDEEINNSRLNFETTCSYTINGICNCDDRNKYYSDNVLRTADNFSTTKHTNMFRACDDEINTLKNTCSYTINGICDCGDPNKYNSDNGLRTADNFSTTEHTNMFQYSDDEINTIISESSTAIASFRQQDIGYDYYQTNDNEEINKSRSNARSELSTTITPISRQDSVCDYYQTKNHGEINNSSSNFTTCRSYTTNVIECNSCEPNKYYSDNRDNIGTTEHFNTFHFHDYENINSVSRKGTSIGSTVLTSVREHENGCFVYLSEYDEAMNEIRSEMFKIVKPTMTSNMEQPTSSFAVISSGQHLNGYNGECKQQPSTSSEHDNDSPLVILCSGIQDHVLPNDLPSDDETSKKVFTEL